MSKYSYDDLTLELLHKILTYDSETGDFYWKHRPRDTFKTLRACNIWNTRFANKKAGCRANRGYSSRDDYCKIEITIFDRNRFAHRLAWFMHYGEWPKDEIDHINGDATDNRIENLRDVSTKENGRNKSIHVNNTTGVTGVSKRNGKFRATIKVDGKSKELGLYDTLEAAAAARKEAEIKYGFHENHGREKANAKG